MNGADAYRAYSRDSDSTGLGEQLNVIITGKSGVGKSTFLNYLVGESVFATGEGEPVTQFYFEEVMYTSPENGVKYRLLDTKGIEPNIADEHKQILVEKIRESDSSTNVFRWIHTVYYCFAASSKRIEPFEINFIRALQKHTSVIILLTKRDLVTADDLKQLQNQINDEIGTSVQVIPVCSVAQQTRKGTSTPSGKEDVLKASFLGLWNKLARTLPYSIKRSLMIEETFWLMDPLLRRRWCTYFRIPKPIVSLFVLSQLPTLHQLSLERLPQSRLTDLNAVLNATERLIDHYDAVAKNNLKVYWQECERIQKIVFDFYKRVNSLSLHVLYSHKAEDAITELIVSFEDSRRGMRRVLEGLKNDVCKVQVSSTPIQWILNNDNREKMRDDYGFFCLSMADHCAKIDEKMDRFIQIAEAELYQYGQCCIRNDENELLNTLKRNEAIDLLSDLSQKEQIYYHTLKVCIGKGIINEVARSVLDALRTVSNIGDIRAGLIEDFVRRNL